MAHHGFRISNGNKQYFGRRLGKCFGCSFPPYELSCAGNSAYKPILAHEKAKLETYLHKLVSGQITELPKEVRDMRPGAHWSDKVTVIVKTGEAGWTELYENDKRRVEWQISGLTSHIARQGALIANWKARPLPSDNK
jgi:hypothetical protein